MINTMIKRRPYWIAARSRRSMSTRIFVDADLSLAGRRVLWRVFVPQGKRLRPQLVEGLLRHVA